jgi:Golgi nucleoside diphosphatase
VSNVALSSFADEPELAGPAILPLVEYVKSVLSRKTDVSMVPLYLKATAGMRLLDGRVVTKIMGSVRKSFKSSGFFFQKLNARVISGEEEGVFGWLTVNFLHQSLGGAPNGTLGALEMGGASTQITFSPKDEILSSFFPLYMNRSLFPLYSHSHLGFGLNEFNRRFDAVVVQRAWSVSKQRLAVINNPCLPSGFMSTNTSVTSDLNHDPISVRFSGTFDFDICAELQLPLLQLRARFIFFIFNSSICDSLRLIVQT